MRPVRPKGPKWLPPKTALAAVLLFTLGSILLWIGVPLWHSADYESDDRERGLSLIILGSITFLPGSYASYMLFGAYRGWPRFDYSQVPSYDD